MTHVHVCEADMNSNIGGMATFLAFHVSNCEWNTEMERKSAWGTAKKSFGGISLSATIAACVYMAA